MVRRSLLPRDHPVLMPARSAGVLGLMMMAVLCAQEEPAIPTADDALLQRIALAHQAITTIQGHAIWKTRADHEAVSEERIQDVQFFLQVPNRYYLTFVRRDDADDKHTFICDGAQQCELQYFPGEAPEAKISPIGHDDATFQRFIAAFRLDLPALSKDFTLVAKADGPGATLTLTPARTEVADQLTKFVITLNAKSQVTALDIDDAHATHITIQVAADVVYDQPIPESRFRMPTVDGK